MSVIAALSLLLQGQVGSGIVGISEPIMIDGYQGFCIGLRPWDISRSGSCTINFSNVWIQFEAGRATIGFHSACLTELQDRPLILGVVELPERIDREVSNAVRRSVYSHESPCVRGTTIEQSELEEMDKIASILVRAVRK